MLVRRDKDSNREIPHSSTIGDVEPLLSPETLVEESEYIGFPGVHAELEEVVPFFRRPVGGYWVLVKLETDAGLAGWGEATGGLETKPLEAHVLEAWTLRVGACGRRCAKACFWAQASPCPSLRV